MAARLDPEDMGRIIRAYQERCAATIEAWGGHIAKYMGDGVLAYFGYPKTEEDEAERAVRAGLELVDGVGALETDQSVDLEARVGIATGRVVVGELIGHGAAQEQTVVGETPNLAARLQVLAEPGSVVISPSTRNLLGALFDLADLGEHDLKGFSAPVRVWRVVGQGPAQNRFEALRGRQLTSLVGREHELGLLLERWSWAKEGDGQVVLLSGEPGIGKSRIVRALRERLAGEPYTPLSHYGSPYHQNTALHPVIGLLERAADFARDDTPDVRLRKLEQLLAPSSEHLEEVMPLVAALLSIPTGDRYPPLELSPQRQKQRTLEVLVDQVEGLASQRPVLAIYEDVQWVDPSTRELLDLLVERARRLPVLVVITFRPEFHPSWTGQAHVASLTLNRLGRRHGSDMVERITGGKSVPAEVLEQIVAKTDGVPLFVEELTKAVVESGLLEDAGDRFELRGPLPELAIPATLQDSLMARLDRLAPVKEIAQIGAVIGRSFSHELLAQVARLPEDRLQQALGELTASELVHRRGTPPDAVYMFKHALVQDAAYQSLLKSRRQQLHARIADVLDEAFPETVDLQPEVAAHHCTEAGFSLRAIELWRRAGEREAERSAHLEAVAHFRKALSLVGSLPGEAGPERLELELLLRLGPVLIAAQGMASPEVAETYGRAHALSREDGASDDQAYAATWGLWLSHQQRGLLDEAQRLAREVLAIAEQTGERDLLLQAHHAGWTTLFFQDDLPACLDHIEQGRVLYDFEAHRGHAFRFGGHDPGVCALATGGLVLWLAGFPDRAVERTDEAIALAERLDHPVSLSVALFFAGILHQYRREPPPARAHLEALLGVCRERHIPHYESSSAILHGWVEAAEGNAEAGVAEVRWGLDLHMRSPVGLRRPYYLGVLAEALAWSGDVEGALTAVDEGLARRQRADDRNWEPELLRLRGELLRQGGGANDDEVEHAFRQAFEAARRQGGRSLELRAATSLARLLAERGKRRQAHDILAPLYGWFSEGFETQDLKDAKALLDEPC